MNLVLDDKTYGLTLIEGGIRITAAQGYDCALDRYGIVKGEPVTEPRMRIGSDGTVYSADGAKLTKIRITQNSNGWNAVLALKDNEQLYGLGDVTRDRLDKHGYKCRMWVTNVKSYAPIPYLMSSEGWAIAVNTTFEHYIDCGATDYYELRIFSKYGVPDITLFAGSSYAELLRHYTAFAGRPAMLPRWAMGLTFVCDTHADVNVMVSDALNFRREDIPCDILGLEPGWMEKNYDASTDKQWSSARFPIPYYAPKGPNTFFGVLERLGFKLSLWLCCDYDLTFYEEKLAGGNAAPAVNTSKSDSAGAFEDDAHFQNSFIMSDTVTKPDEPWFEHLKKFVDQGAAAFKLDGAYQTLDHPDRLWGNGMLDREAHNLYPVIYAKQMSRGFIEHTGKRSMIYTACGYTGIQKYAATWAGDTGGGFRPLLSMLNHGLSGHSNTSCDMDVFSIESIHFGFLQPWSQLNSWNYWRHPWLLTEEDKELFKFYDKLRYSLVPYLYTAAHEAYETGMPIMRALPLAYPHDPMAYECLAEYMLGSDLLVGVFLGQVKKISDGKEVNMYLPGGEWYDFWTGEKFTGGVEINYIPPQGRGGALFVRSGAAIPFAQARKSIGDKPYEEYILRIWGDSASGTLYTDDGATLNYENGEFALTSFSYKDGAVTAATEGSYAGMLPICCSAETFDNKPVEVIFK